MTGEDDTALIAGVAGLGAEHFEAPFTNDDFAEELLSFYPNPVPTREMRLEVVRLLCAQGANSDAQDSEGKTASDIAREKQLEEVLGMIRRPVE